MSSLPGVLLTVSLLLAQPEHDSPVPSGPAAGAQKVCIPIEVFIREQSRQCELARSFLDGLAKRRRDVLITYHDVVKDRPALVRLHALCRQFGNQTPGVPGILVCNQFLVGFRDDQTSGREIEDLLTIEVFTREGCPHCAQARVFLANLASRYPGLQIQFSDVFQDAGARQRMQQLAERSRVQVPSLPMFSIYGRVIVGFWDTETTGAEIEKLVKRTTTLCPAGDAAGTADQLDRPRPPVTGARLRRLLKAGLHVAPAIAWAETVRPVSLFVLAAPPQGPDESPVLEADAAPPLEPDLVPDAIPPVDEGIPPEAPEQVRSRGNDEIDGPPEGVSVPIFGRLDWRSLGMPAFTFLIGLVDGFNPCAMWVLVFVLSVLVNLKDRRKIVLIAGTFVMVSGLVYFTFMAAWLNVFLLIGFARPAQIVLGLFACTMGIVNVKDFFAFGRGFSFSIPAAAKPGIYDRVRQIVMAKYTGTALIGAVVLAVLVNMIELLCTAGLPALYTEVLTFQQLPAWTNYLYLLLYNVAYMLDDSIMLTVAVVTLSHRKMQEAEGRWLKLISGLVILALGSAMLFKPEWLF